MSTTDPANPYPQSRICSHCYLDRPYKAYPTPNAHRCRSCTMYLNKKEDKKEEVKGVNKTGNKTEERKGRMGIYVKLIMAKIKTILQVLSQIQF